MNKSVFTIIILFLLLVGRISAQSENVPLVYKINIKQEINSTALVHLQNGLYHAAEKKADYILIDLNTYGGGLLEADSIRTAILNTKTPVYVFVNNNAASAGALIAIACDKIFMRSGANMGAATVVDGTGEKAPDKYQSYMRSIIRSTAESHGKDTVKENGVTTVTWKRDPQIAEAMVDERVVIPNVVDSSKVLTLTANEAVELGYCDGVAENIPEILTRHLGFEKYDLETYNPTFFDQLKGFLMNGAVQAVLIMFIIGGIYFEMKTPGFGLPSAIAITAAILYFTPLYMDGYAQNWEIIVFVIGLILIAFEIFVIPGFGVAGISGILLAATGLFLSLIGNIEFDFKGVPTQHLLNSSITVLAGLTLSIILIIYFASRIGKKGLFYKVALHSDQEGFLSVSDEPRSLIGKTGVSATVLRPSGKIIVGNEYYDAVANHGFIDKGKLIKVIKYENSQVYVNQIEE